MPRDKAISHEKTCPKGIVSCQYSKDCKGIRRESLEAHEMECKYKPVKCKHCEEDIQIYLLESHYLECPSYPIACNWCNHDYIRKDESVHMQELCLKKPKPCPYSAFGCSTPWMVKELLDKHIIENMNQHLQLTCKYYNQKLLNLQLGYDKKIEVLEKNIRALSLRDGLGK